MERIRLAVSCFMVLESGEVLMLIGVDREFVEFAKRRQVDDIVNGY